MAKTRKAPEPLEALNIREAFIKKLKQKKDTPAVLFELLEKKPNSNGNNYTRQKQKIIDYKPTNRKEKQIKTLAVYCLKIRQRRAEGKKIYFNPLLVEIANSPDIIKALEQTRPADFKQLKKAVINSSLRGKNKTTKQEILNNINGRQRLYRDYTDQKNSKTRTKEKLYTPTDKNKAEQMQEQLKATAQQRPELVETFERLKVGEKKAPELKAIRTYNSNKRAERTTAEIRDRVEQPATLQNIKKAVIGYIKSRKKTDTRTTAGELLTAYQTAGGILAEMKEPTRPELSKAIRTRTEQKATARNIAEQKKTARKGYERKKKATRPPLFDRNPIVNGQLTRTAEEIHAEELREHRQRKAINKALFNIRYTAEADRLQIHREQQRRSLKNKAFEMIAQKIK